MAWVPACAGMTPLACETGGGGMVVRFTVLSGLDEVPGFFTASVIAEAGEECKARRWQP